jgi:hypothetical protein
VFRVNISLLSSGSKITKRNEQIEAGGKVDETRVGSLAGYWPSIRCHSPIQAWTGRTIHSWSTQLDSYFCGYLAWLIVRP